MKGAIENGRARTIDVRFPQMRKHMMTIDRLTAKKAGLQLAASGDIIAKYRCYFEHYSLDYLKLFAK
jgi:hypothetical protein